MPSSKDNITPDVANPNFGEGAGVSTIAGTTSLSNPSCVSDFEGTH
jgi:hypothetical protein